jgi:hypothetical protein
VNAEFNWWLLIVGLVVGAGLVWLVIADWSRRDQDLDVDERAAESAWIAQTLQERGLSLDPGDAEQVLALHRAYLHHLGGGIFDDELPADDAADVAADDFRDVPIVTPAAPEPTDGAAAGAWLHTAPDAAAGPPKASDESPATTAARPTDAVDRGTLRPNPLAPRGGAGMDPEPPRPS